MTDRKTDLVIFFSTLADFDWFYSFSDDHRTWTKGEKTFETLRKEAQTDPIKLNMWQSWVTYVNDHIKGLRVQKPELSDFALS